MITCFEPHSQQLPTLSDMPQAVVLQHPHMRLLRNSRAP